MRGLGVPEAEAYAESPEARNAKSSVISEPPLGEGCARAPEHVSVEGRARGVNGGGSVYQNERSVSPPLSSPTKKLRKKKPK